MAYEFRGFVRSTRSFLREVPAGRRRWAMRGAPARAIQELAGHKDLSTSQRYMHLSPAAIESAIRLLDRRDREKLRGDTLATGDRENEKTNP